jgi:hypothetical protein
LRTNDIEGANMKKFYWDMKTGKKVKNFFTTVPLLNDFYNSISPGIENTNE